MTFCENRTYSINKFITSHLVDRYIVRKPVQGLETPRVFPSKPREGEEQVEPQPRFAEPFQNDLCDSKRLAFTYSSLHVAGTFFE
jgi:hypothetical protein